MGTDSLLRGEDMARPEILKCVLCGREYAPEHGRYVCDSCGLDGTLDVLYDMHEAKKLVTKDSLSLCRDMSMWRYRDIMPVLNDANIPALLVGWTPLYENKWLASKYGVRKLYIKDDGRNPTASLKDRASAVGVAKALDFGQKTVACASTGNAASSLSGFAAVTKPRARACAMLPNPMKPTFISFMSCFSVFRNRPASRHCGTGAHFE